MIYEQTTVFVQIQSVGPFGLARIGLDWLGLARIVSRYSVPAFDPSAHLLPTRLGGIDFRSSWSWLAIESNLDGGEKLCGFEMVCYLSTLEYVAA